VFRIWLAEKWYYGFALVLAIYVAGIFCMMMTFFQQNIAIATVAAILVNIVTYLLVARILYGDTLSMLQITGLALGLAAIVILESA